MTLKTIRLLSAPLMAMSGAGTDRIEAASELIAVLDVKAVCLDFNRAATAFNLNDPARLQEFLRGQAREISILGTDQKLEYDALARVGVGISSLGPSEAVAVGTYAFALRQLDTRGKANL